MFVEYVVGMFFQYVEVIQVVCFVVFGFDQELLGLFVVQVGVDQVLMFGEFFVIQGEVEMVFFQVYVWIVQRCLGVLVLDDDIVGVVVFLGDVVFEIGIVQWMVFNLYCELFYCWVEVWFFGYCLVFQGVIQFQVEVVVQVVGVVFLDVIVEQFGVVFVRFVVVGFWGLVEIVFVGVFGEWFVVGYGGFFGVQMLGQIGVLCRIMLMVFFSFFRVIGLSSIGQGVVGLMLM